MTRTTQRHRNLLLRITAWASVSQIGRLKTVPANEPSAGGHRNPRGGSDLATRQGQGKPNGNETPIISYPAPPSHRAQRRIWHYPNRENRQGLVAEPSLALVAPAEPETKDVPTYACLHL